METYRSSSVVNCENCKEVVIPCEYNCSSAEVRTLAYRSGDQNLINLFETGQDVYIYTAKSMLGEEKWSGFDKAEKKKWRKIFKVVYLAVAYRMSARTLGTTLNVPEQEAQGYIDALFAQFPVLEKFIVKNSEFPIHHNGYIDTELGDSLRASAFRYLYTPGKDGKPKVDNRIVAKLGSAGINYRIQSFSALSLASGFSNVVQEANKREMLVKNIIVVHDSSQNLFNINYLFDIRKFYDTNFHDYAKERYGISFNYDLEVGVSYGEMVSLKVLSPTEIQLKGTASVLNKIFYKIENESDLNVEYNVPLETIIPDMEEDAMKRFVVEHQGCMDHDYSEYEVVLKRLS